MRRPYGFTAMTHVTAHDYHERTKHFRAATTTQRRVEAALVPKQYKRYVDLPSLALPAPAPSASSFFDSLTPIGGPAGRLTMASLAAVLHYSAGIVRRSSAGGRELAFRAASCTGAAYHLELYVVCGAIDHLPAGVYHYDVLTEALRPLRTGDFRDALAQACCDETIVSADASVVITSTFWRNAWRYEERAYRHVFWDAGTVLANLLALAENEDLAPALRTAFVDHEVNALRGLDARREAAVAVVSLSDALAGAGVNVGSLHAGTLQRPETAKIAGVSPLALRTEPLSRAEIEYPLIWQTHESTSLRDCPAVQDWRSMSTPAPPPAWTRHSSPPRASRSLQEAIERRGSSRRFTTTPMSREAFTDTLVSARGSLCSDQTLAGVLIRPFVIVNRIEGVEPGAYALDPAGNFSLVRAGDLSKEAARLALDQPAAGRAAANLYFVASHSEVAAMMGERGYRAVQLEAGMRVGQVYLAAASLGLRVTGLTFYDDEVARFFGLDPVDTLVLMLVAFGP